MNRSHSGPFRLRDRAFGLWSFAKAQQMSINQLFGYVRVSSRSTPRRLSHSSEGTKVTAAQMPGTKLSATAVAVAFIANLFLGKGMSRPIMMANLLSFKLSPLIDLLRRSGTCHADEVTLSDQQIQRVTGGNQYIGASTQAVAFAWACATPTLEEAA